MRPDFEYLIRDLYVSLGLPVPTEFGESGVRLVVGETEIELVPHPYDPRLLVRAEVGLLQDERFARARQIEDLLRRHAGNILDFAATLAIDPESGDRTIVAATVPYGPGATAQLRAVIEDVATLAERYRPVFQTTTAPRQQVVRHDDEPAMIFQP